mmetsp:Transcript_63768/g.152043  ORF Transcript_63768/g.152043 Transcript_63768/m.152043 type:complete len:214 (-) Transcript_63768:1500-2141(-)
MTRCSMNKDPQSELGSQWCIARHHNLHACLVDVKEQPRGTHHITDELGSNFEHLCSLRKVICGSVDPYLISLWTRHARLVAEAHFDPALAKPAAATLLHCRNVGHHKAWIVRWPNGSFILVTGACRGIDHCRRPEGLGGRNDVAFGINPSLVPFQVKPNQSCIVLQSIRKNLRLTHGDVTLGEIQVLQHGVFRQRLAESCHYIMALDLTQRIP